MSFAEETQLANVAGTIINPSTEEKQDDTITEIEKLTTDCIEARAQTPTKTNAVNVQIGPGDIISNIPVVVDYPHHQIHEGESWLYANLQTGGLASGSNFDIRILTANVAATTRTPHFEFELIASGEAEMYLHQGVTWTAGGTAVAASANTTARVNRNHNVGGTPGTALYVNGGTALTVNSTGTIVGIWYLPSGRTGTGGGDRSVQEIDLAANTEYMLRITSRTAGLKFLVRLHWYEDLGV